MKHNAELIKLLLLDIRDGGHNNAIQEYPEPLVLDQSAQLIDQQFVDGHYTKGSHGEIASVAMVRLLPRGHEYLSQLQQTNPQSTDITTRMPTAPLIFISHSSADRDLAAALVDLLRDLT